MRHRRSAGILLYRRGEAGLEVLLVHPGGPYWAHQDEGAWSIPKGEYAPQEEALSAAQREFQEETGLAVSGPFMALTPVRLAGGKLVSAWAAQGDFDPARLRSTHFELEWPPNSGVRRQFPEVDRGGWFSLAEAHRKLAAGQRALLDELARRLAVGERAQP